MQQFKSKDYVTILLVITNIAVYIFCTIQGNVLYNMGSLSVVDIDESVPACESTAYLGQYDISGSTGRYAGEIDWPWQILCHLYAGRHRGQSAVHGA